MGKLYDIVGPECELKAVEAFEQDLRRTVAGQIVDKEVGECLLFLATYYKKVGDRERAIELARRLSDLQGI